MTFGTFYRYSRVSGEHISYVEQLIVENKLYFSSPLQFNDPFDCRIDGLRFSESSVKEFFVNRHSRLFGRQLAELLFHSRGSEWIGLCDRLISELREQVLREFSIACFTTERDNILMYSHYADGHKGICFEFNLPENNTLKLEKVNYTREFPALMFSDEREHLLRLATAILTTKADLWSYESEYRSIRGAPCGISEYPPEYLTGLIFGCLADPQIKHRIIDAVIRSGKNIKIYTAVPSNSSFSVEIVPY